MNSAGRVTRTRSLAAPRSGSGSDIRAPTYCSSLGRARRRRALALESCNGESVALVPKCVECAIWLPADSERWRAYLGCDEDLDEPAEVVLLCHEFSELEFGGG